MIYMAGFLVFHAYSAEEDVSACAVLVSPVP